MNTNGNGHKPILTLETETRFKELRRPWWRNSWVREHKKVLWCVAIGLVLLTARQFNTVKDRYWITGNRTWPSGAFEIRKVDDLFGSTYHLYHTGAVRSGNYILGEIQTTDLGQSKVFDDLFLVFNNNAR